MSKPRPKASVTDQYARQIARAIAKGRLPPRTPDLDRYLEESPNEIYAAFDGAARYMPPRGKDESLAFGYLFLLQGLLERLRFRADRGYAEAIGQIAAFQAEVAAKADADEIDQHMLGYVSGTLHQAKIAASPELVAVSAKHRIDDDDELPADVSTALDGMLEACAGDAFGFVGAIAEFGHAMPEEARCALASSLALSDRPDGRAAAVMFLLDPSPAVRRATAGALGQAASSLSPVDLRRLIAMRNWRPEGERADVDVVIRNARTAGIACAQWEAGRTEIMLATAVDGAASQVFLLVSPAGRKKRISSILAKEGVADAWSGEPESSGRIEAAMAAAGMDVPALAVSRPYLDRMLSHYLALTTDRGEAPPLGLLQVSETIGGADWQPARIDVREALAELIADIPRAMRESAAVAAVLRQSGQLIALEPLKQSWFEDDMQVAQMVGGRHGRGRAKVATYLLQSVFAQRRDKWADLFLRTAMWLREAPVEADPCWRELALVAKAVADGRDLTEIGLMRDIAERTILALASA